MASAYQAIKTLTMEAGGNLSGRQYHALTINGSGQVELANAATEIVYCILAEDPGTTAAGDEVTVMDVAAGGIGLVQAQAAITAGHILHATTTGGKVAGVANPGALAADQAAFGIALQSASAADEVIMFKAHPVAVPHTT